jgi:hypothetical protein
MLEDLIARARRRYVLNEALGQFAFAAAIAIAGLALILLVGWNGGLFRFSSS